MPLKSNFIKLTVDFHASEISNLNKAIIYVFNSCIFSSPNDKNNGLDSCLYLENVIIPSISFEFCKYL